MAVRAIKQKHDGVDGRQQSCTSAERKVSPRRARRQKHWGGARVPGPQLSRRTGILVAGRSLLMVIVARSVGDVRCVLDQLVPGASAGLLLIDCALFAACHYSNQQ